jgi:hypothetical protein
MDHWQTEHILLGSGGHRPALRGYNLLSGKLTEVLQLPEGDSVYSIAACPEGGLLAIGTKAGRVYLLREQGTDGHTELYLAGELKCWGAVLSVCFAEPETLAIADTAGGLLLWQTGESGVQERLLESTAVLYALFRLDDDLLAGLTVSGELIVWDLSAERMVEVATISPPPAYVALVKPLYWAHEGVWVWPGQEGSIVVYSHKTGSVRVIGGHAGDVYAITVCGQELITIGAADCQIKRWRLGCDEPVATFGAPEAVISATVWDQKNSQILLVDASGRAAIYSWASGPLELVAVVPGQDYRVALGPEPAAFRSLLLHHEAETVKRLAQQADEQIARGRWDELEPTYQQIIDLRYPQVVCALRGRQARMRDDFLGEFTAYHKLARIVPHDQDGARNALRRYAELLELVWDLRGSLSLYQKLSALGPTHDGYLEKIHRLSDHVAAVQKQPYVIEAEIPLPLLVKAAIVSGRKLTGRYQLLSTGATECRADISVDEVMERHRHLVGSKPQSAAVHKMDLCWLSKDRKERTCAIVLSGEDHDLFPYLELVIRFFDIQRQTVLIRALVLNADAGSADGTAEQHNKTILDQLACIQNAPLLDSWCQTTYRDMRTAIRQLVTRGRAQRIHNWGIA